MARVTSSVKLEEKKFKRAEQAADWLNHAAELNFKDACRQGMLLTLPLVGELVVGADLHGNRKNFQAIQTFCDLPHHPDRQLVLLGDWIHALDLIQTGKDFSCLLLEEVARLKIQFPSQVHLLLGNHELSEFQGRHIFKDGKLLNFFFQRGLQLFYGESGAEVFRQALDNFIASLPIAVRTQTKIWISHSTPEKSVAKKIPLTFFAQNELIFQDRKQLKILEEVVWGRDFSEKTARFLSELWDTEIFIVGHEKCAEGYQVPNTHHIILDSTDHYGTLVHLKLHQPYAQRGIVRQIRYLETLDTPIVIDEE
ncbi:MAG: metallophosphoesterase [Planctomycetota bacterium]